MIQQLPPQSGRERSYIEKHLVAVYSFHSSVMENQTGSKFIATPKTFGLPIWNSDECNIFEHLAQLEIGLKLSEERGCNLEMRQNLILMTLPSSYVYVSEFVTESRGDMETFKRRIIELIAGSNTEQTNLLMMAVKKPDEHILTYLNRLIAMYLYCATKDHES